MRAEPGGDRAAVLVGGVGQLYQGDLDVGRLVAERLSGYDLGPAVRVEELHYGAVAVTQLLHDVAPDTLVLAGAEARGRPPATVERRRVRPRPRSPQELQDAVGRAVTGYVTIDLVIDVAQALGELPPRIVTVEVEPVQTGPSAALSPAVTAVLDDVVDMVRTEARRAPLLVLADRLHDLVDDDHLAASPATSELRSLLGQLVLLEESGRWGSTFARRDRLRALIAHGDLPEGMDRVDCALWWALIEELDRLQQIESSTTA